MRTRGEPVARQPFLRACVECRHGQLMPAKRGDPQTVLCSVTGKRMVARSRRACRTFEDGKGAGFGIGNNI